MGVGRVVAGHVGIGRVVVGRVDVGRVVASNVGVGHVVVGHVDYSLCRRCGSHERAAPRSREAMQGCCIQDRPWTLVQMPHMISSCLCGGAVVL